MEKKIASYDEILASREMEEMKSVKIRVEVRVSLIINNYLYPIHVVCVFVSSQATDDGSTRRKINK